MRYLVLLFIPVLAFGTSKPQYDVDSKAYSESAAYSEGATAHGGYGEGGSAVAKGGEGGNSHASGGSVGDINITESRPRSDVTIRNTPAAFAPTVYPSAPCFKSGSAAGSGPGISLAIGGGRIDKGCERRELIRMAYQMGMTSQAESGWCLEAVRTKMFKNLKECMPPPAPVVAPPEYTDKVVHRLESVEQTQMDAQASLQAEIDDLRAQLAQEKNRRVRASKAAQERQKRLNQIAVIK